MAKTCQYKDCERGTYSQWCLLHKPRKALPKPSNPIPRHYKEIRKIGKRGKANQSTTRKWRESIKDDADWSCYLRIHQYCPIWLTPETTVPEHKIPKSRGQAYAHDLNNIKKACTWCNQLKGSRTIEALAKEYPHLASVS